jgi:hypothetical protein
MIRSDRRMNVASRATIRRSVVASNWAIKTMVGLLRVPAASTSTSAGSGDGKGRAPCRPEHGPVQMATVGREGS